MFNDDHNASPINPLPPVVILFCVAIAGIELVFQAAENGVLGGAMSIGWRMDAIRSYGYFNSVLSWMIQTGRTPPEHLLRFISYPFVHAGLSHAVFAVVFILAIGKMVAEAFSTLAFVLIFFASSIAGALAYSLVTTDVPLIGAYPPVYGLIGAMTFMLWVRAKVEGNSQARAFSLIAALLGIQLVFKLIFGGGSDWIADLAGFATGFLLSFVLAPNGYQRVLRALERVRRRG